MTAWALVLLGAVSLLAAAEGVVLYFAVRALARLIRETDGLRGDQKDILRDVGDLDAAVRQLADTAHADDGPSTLAKVYALIERTDALEGSSARAAEADLESRMLVAEAKLERLLLKSGFR